jgi:RNA polymerase sigma-70 factor, ECF subfamily
METAMAKPVVPKALHHSQESFLMEGLTDEQLVTVLRGGGHEGFEELARRYEGRLTRTAMRILGSKEDSEDMVQDTFLKAFQRIDSFQGRSAFYTWLTSVLINGCLMQLRKRRAKPHVSLDQLMDVGRVWSDGRVDIEASYLLLEQRAILASAVAKLAPKLRVVVDQYCVGDFSIAELAELNGISISAAKSRLMRARNSLSSSAIVRCTKTGQCLSSSNTNGLRP